ncbi:unnamed protein product [Sphagnum jensenii]|uniref:C-type lectin domain-containing protein n=1 Tax=Sphagnum jensenii TaxID=128206 RepID=A0ABP0VDB0_9BRYO
MCNLEYLKSDSFVPTLVSIKSAAEQEYLTKFVFDTSEVETNVWIGAKRRPDNGNQFVWNDGSVIEFTNWAEGSPSDQVKKECVLMRSQYTRGLSNIAKFDTLTINGKWGDVTCETTNWVLCQKLQTWSFPQLQKKLLDIKKELKDSLENVTKQLDNTKNQLEDTRNQLRDVRNELNDTRNKVSASAPAGTIAFFARNTAPTGWLKANGATISRITYADLFAAIGTTFGSGDGNKTFRLPDLRGEFIRGWSDGREVDKGRAFGSYQWGSNIPLAGYVGGNWERAISSGYQDRWNFAGNTFDEGFEPNVSAGETRSGTTFPVSNSSSCRVHYLEGPFKYSWITSWNVLKGTRPRNVALLACIKY